MVKQEHPNAQISLRGLEPAGTGAPADCCADTGADQSFISREFIRKVRVQPQSAAGIEVWLAMGEIAKDHSACEIAGCYQIITLFTCLSCVAKLAVGCDLLLGLDILRQFKSAINVPIKHVHFGTGDMVLPLRLCKVRPSIVQVNPPVISVKQRVRCMRKGCPVSLDIVSDLGGIKHGQTVTDAIMDNNKRLQPTASQKQDGTKGKGMML